MRKKRVMTILLAAALVVSMLAGCGAADKKEKADSITVYLWSNSLYATYAPYI